MALLRCTECGKDVSSKASKCPNCGAPIKKKTGCFTKLFLLLVVLVAVGSVLSTINTPNKGNSTESRSAEVASPAIVTQPPRQASSPPPVVSRVPYQIVTRSPIPNGGEAKAIAISPAFATDAGMTALAQTLLRDTRDDRNAFIYIYGDVRAAKMRDRLDNLTPAEDAFYARYSLGTYFRNANNGVHEMEMHPSGMDGPSRTLKF